MPSQDPFGGNEELKRLITKYWDAPEDAEWTPKTEVLPLDELWAWMKSKDIEILGFAYSMIGNGRLRIEPPMAPEEYVGFFQRVAYEDACLWPEGGRSTPLGKTPAGS